MSQGSRTDIPLALTDVPLTMRLRLLPPVVCEGGNPIAGFTNTDVVDSQSQPVEHTNTPPTSSDLDGFGTTVTFTPRSPGLYVVSASFEPSLGVVQSQVQVAENVRNVAPALRMPVSQPCDSAWGLSSSALCLRNGTLTRLNGEEVTLEEGVVGLRTQANVAWWWTQRHVIRGTEHDGGFRSERITASLQAGLTSANAHVLTHVADGMVWEVRALDAGLSLTQWPLGGELPVGSGLARAGNVIGYTTAKALCAAAPDASVNCSETDFINAGSDDETLWLRGPASGAVGAARFGGDLRLPPIQLINVFDGSLQYVQSNGPIFTWKGRLVTPQASDLTLQAWTPPGPITAQWATAEHVFFQLQTNELVMFHKN